MGQVAPEVRSSVRQMGSPFAAQAAPTLNHRTRSVCPSPCSTVPVHPRPQLNIFLVRCGYLMPTPLTILVQTYCPSAVLAPLEPSFFF